MTTDIEHGKKHPEGGVEINKPKRGVDTQQAKQEADARKIAKAALLESKGKGGRKEEIAKERAKREALGKRRESVAAKISPEQKKQEETAKEQEQKTHKWLEDSLAEYSDLIEKDFEKYFKPDVDEAHNKQMQELQKLQTETVNLKGKALIEAQKKILSITEQMAENDNVTSAEYGQFKTESKRSVREFLKLQLELTKKYPDLFQVNYRGIPEPNLDNIISFAKTPEKARDLFEAMNSIKTIRDKTSIDIVCKDAQASLFVIAFAETGRLMTRYSPGLESAIDRIKTSIMTPDEHYTPGFPKKPAPPDYLGSVLRSKSADVRFVELAQNGQHEKNKSSLFEFIVENIESMPFDPMKVTEIIGDSLLDKRDISERDKLLKLLFEKKSLLDGSPKIGYGTIDIVRVAGNHEKTAKWKNIAEQSRDNEISKTIVNEIIKKYLTYINPYWHKKDKKTGEFGEIVLDWPDDNRAGDLRPITDMFSDKNFDKLGNLAIEALLPFIKRYDVGPLNLGNQKSEVSTMYVNAEGIFKKGKDVVQNELQEEIAKNGFSADVLAKYAARLKKIEEGLEIIKKSRSAEKFKVNN